jgi:hypothetical protein
MPARCYGGKMVDSSLLSRSRVSLMNLLKARVCAKSEVIVSPGRRNRNQPENFRSFLVWRCNVFPRLGGLFMRVFVSII